MVPDHPGAAIPASDPAIKAGEGSDVLRAESVRKRYGAAVALDGVSLAVRRGECVALVGESGSGKSTLLRTFNRMVEPDEGRVFVDGGDVRAADPIALRRGIGYVQQDGGLLPHWNVLRNAAMVPWLRGQGDAEALARAALALVGLPAEQFGSRQPRELSGGQRQRVAIARALAARPAIVLLDEPFGALDAITRSDAQDMLETVRRDTGVTTLLVTHDLHEAFRLADRVAVMRAGRVEQVAPPDEVRARPATKYVGELLARVGHGARLSLLLAALGLAGAPTTSRAQSAPPAASTRPVVVASKPFGESYLLAEMFAQLLEARGFAVDRRPGLGATQVAFGALRTGAVDVYPEYTGTGLVAILGEAPAHDPHEVLRRVSRSFRERYGARWLAPLGFENTYAIAVRRETARTLGLRTLSDLSREAPKLIAGLTPDFIGRPDGLEGLRRAYGGMAFRETRSLLQAVKYAALDARAVDVIDGYSTDGAIARYDFVVLEDDRGFFPSYQAAPLVGERLWRESPAAIAALSELAGLLDEEQMRRLNRRLEVDNEPVAAVAADALRGLGLVSGAAAGLAGAAGAAGGTSDTAVAGGRRPAPGFARYLWMRRGEVLRLTARHLWLVLISLVAAIVVAVPLGLALERLTTRGAEGAIKGIGLLQTLPSIALLAFMIPLIGIGIWPALVALFLYALYPIVRNTYSGVRDASPDAVAAARALGMTDRQILRYVRLPLAAPVIMAGVRTAGVIGVGTATLAAFIGAGGLGDPIVAGLALADSRMILSGAIPAAVLALVVDGALAQVERRVRPAG
jgi:osmoprotectant transport system permease protein